jgi:NADH:ubiquinone oxidoreductase subunit E
MPCAHEKHVVDGIVRSEPWVDYERDFIKVCHCEQCVKQGFANDLMDRLRKHYSGSRMQLVAGPSPGTCARGNSVVINEQVAVLKDMDNIEERLDKEIARQQKHREDHPEEKKDVIKVCFGPSCGRREAEDIEKKLWSKYKSDETTRIMRCGCLGNCAKSANVVVNGNIISKQSPLRVMSNIDTELSKQRKASLVDDPEIASDEIDDILSLGF